MIEECLAVEFQVSDDDCPLVEATRRIETGIDARPPQLRYDGYVLLRFSAPTNDRLRKTLDADERIRYLHVASGDGRDSFRCLSKHPCVVHELISSGLIVDTIQYRDGRATFFGWVVGREELRGVMESAGQTVGVTLNRVYPLQSDATGPPRVQWDITPPQEECLRIALEMGYFSIPRGADASAVAAELGISKTAFLERLHRAEESLFTQIFG